MTVGAAAGMLSAALEWVIRRRKDKEKHKEKLIKKQRLDALETMQLATMNLVKKNGEETAAKMADLSSKFEEAEARRRNWWWLR